VYIEFYAGGVSFMTLIVPAARMIMMFVIITVLHAAGEGHYRHSQDQCKPRDHYDVLFHINDFRTNYPKTCQERGVYNLVI
jgi:hypothetical protein